MIYILVTHFFSGGKRLSLQSASRNNFQPVAPRAVVPEDKKAEVEMVADMVMERLEPRLAQLATKEDMQALMALMQQLVHQPAAAVPQVQPPVPAPLQPVVDGESPFLHICLVLTLA